MQSFIKLGYNKLACLTGSLKSVEDFWLVTFLVAMTVATSGCHQSTLNAVPGSPVLRNLLIYS